MELCFCRFLGGLLESGVVARKVGGLAHGLIEPDHLKLFC